MAIKDVYESSPYFQSLNGNWKFHWVSKVSEVPEGFYEESYDVSGWDEMPVPGNWEFNGYGVPMCVNTGFGFRARPAPTVMSPAWSWRIAVLGSKTAQRV